MFLICLAIFPPYFRYVGKFYKKLEVIWSSEKKDRTVRSLGVGPKKSIVDPAPT